VIRMAWTAAQEKFLVDNYYTMSGAEVAKSLGKSKPAVYQRAKLLRLSRKKARGKKMTLCTDCDNARADRCRWARYANPDKGVEGWRAVPVVVSNGNNPIDTVRVDYCPKFKRAGNAG